MIGLFKTEEIHRRGPWKRLEDVEFATLEWEDRFGSGSRREQGGEVSDVRKVLQARHRLDEHVRPRGVSVANASARNFASSS